MTRRRPASRPRAALRALALSLAAGAAGTLLACGPQPVQGINAVQTQQAQRLPAKMVYAMPPAAAVPAQRGVVETTVLRSPDELGRFASSLPKEFDPDRYMLVFQGPRHQFESQRDSASGLRIVDANSGDIYKPGVHVTSTSMTTVIHVLLPADPCCGAAATTTTTTTTTSTADASSGEVAGVSAAAQLPTNSKVPVDVKKKTPDVPVVVAIPGEEGTETTGTETTGTETTGTETTGTETTGTETTGGTVTTVATCDNAAAEWSDQLVLFAVPRAEGVVQFSVEEEPCPK